MDARPKEVQAVPRLINEKISSGFFILISIFFKKIIVLF